LFSKLHTGELNKCFSIFVGQPDNDEISLWTYLSALSLVLSVSARQPFKKI